RDARLLECEEVAAHVAAHRRNGAECTRPETAASDTRVDFLSLLGFADVSEMLGPALWPGRAGSARLAVPIGLSPAQTPVMIDLKESAQGGMGPHGLCIGAT